MKRKRIYSTLSNGQLRNMTLIEFESEEDRKAVISNTRIIGSSIYTYFKQPVSRDNISQRHSPIYHQRGLGSRSIYYSDGAIYKHQSVIKRLDFGSRYGRKEALVLPGIRCPVVDKSNLRMFTEYIERVKV